MGRGRRGGFRLGGGNGRGQQEGGNGEVGKWEGRKRGKEGISQMDMKSLRGMRLQGFLTLFTRATPGTPASILIKQVIVCLFICSLMDGQTARPNGLKFGG